MPIETPSLEAATQFLAGRYGASATDVAELGGGDWSRAFSFRLEGRDLVARFGIHVEDFRADERAMAFNRAEVPVPAVLEIGEALGGYYAISVRHFGRFLEELDEPGWRAVLPALLSAFDALRGIELPPGIGVDWKYESSKLSWREWLMESLQDQGGRTGGWRANLDADPASAEVYLAGERAVRSLVDACPESRHVLHRDLINRNVLVSHDAAHIEAVFDWGCSMAGDSLYEVAWLTFWSFWFPALASVDFGAAIATHYERIGLSVDNFDERLRCYEIQIGLEHIAYAIFTQRPDHLRNVTRRTSEILQRSMDI